MPDKYYQDGFIRGYEDSKSGVERHPRPGFTKSLFSRSYVDQFIKGYHHGYNTRSLEERKHWTNQQARQQPVKTESKNHSGLER